jgi:hypothetical protein
MTTAVLTDRFSSQATSVADTALAAAARLWYLTAVIGQLVFVFAVASFYTSAAVRGNFLAWNRFMRHGYVPGDTMGNVTLAVHLFLAVFIVTSGALQLVPQIRHRAPLLHRWNGRLYILAAFAISSAGLYLSWVRGGSSGDISQLLGISLNAVLIMLFAGMALRTAMARDFTAHRPWALRLFLAVSGVWFLRIGVSLSLLIFKRPFGFDPNTFQGPFLTFMAFASYLVPLAVLELYLRAQSRPSAPGRMAMAGGLLVLTVATGAGIFGATMVFWLPTINAAFDSRKSIDQALSATIASEGVDAAVRQYRQLKAAQPAAYNFEERELSVMGRRLIREKKLEEGIRILQLNVEAYPQSSKAHQRLGDAYMVQGNTALAIANHQKSLELDPNNRDAAEALQKLKVP